MLRRSYLSMLLVSVLLLVLGHGNDPSAAALPLADVRFEGHFRWNQGSNEPRPLSGRLRPLGEGRWQAEFHFRFHGGRHRWRGELRGNLESGAVTGEVSNGRGRRPRIWRLEGTASGGRIVARHFEQLRRGENLTGTIELVPNQ